MRLRNSTSRSRHAARVAPWRGIVERLEDRTLLSVDVSKTFAGMALDPQAPNFPPDVAAAVGPDHMVEAVNDSIAFFNKKTGKMIDRQLLVDFFAPVLPSAELWFHIGDPKVTYDELAGRFIVTAADLDFDARTSFLVVAVSDDSDPRGRWEMHRINVEDLDKYWGDFPQLAWDADAIYVMLDMFPWFPAGSTAFHHSSVITINKATVLDGDNSTFTFTDVDSTEQFDMQPAVMHGASPGAPMYFVEAMPGNGCGNGDFLQIWKMTDKLSPAPTFTNFHVQVPLFRCQPNATQPGGQRCEAYWGLKNWGFAIWGGMKKSQIPDRH